MLSRVPKFKYCSEVLIVLPVTLIFAMSKLLSTLILVLLIVPVMSKSYWGDEFLTPMR